MTKILIGIQARSGSTRFPGKIYEYVGSRRVLDHVIDRAFSAANHAMFYKKTKDIKAIVAVLHPHGDKRLTDTFRSSRAQLISGPEEDVLARYVIAQKMTEADYVVRLTSDCPLILEFLINKHINCALFNQHDYVNNVDEECRTIADGFDCEIMSAKALAWLDENAKGEEREHVTLALRRHRPDHLSYGFVSSQLDSSSLKLSVDTTEDLDKIRAVHHTGEHRADAAKRIYGKAVYRI